jgi:hypothetical protein
MNSRDKPSEAKGRKKPYRRPVIETYGNVRDLTKVAGGTRGANDTVQMANKTGI